MEAVSYANHLTGQLGSTLGTTTLEHITAGFGGHTLQEAVFTGARALLHATLFLPVSATRQRKHLLYLVPALRQAQI